MEPIPTVITHDRGWWNADVDGVGVTQGYDVDECVFMAHDLVACMRDIPITEVSLTITVEAGPLGYRYRPVLDRVGPLKNAITDKLSNAWQDRRHKDV